LQPEPRKDAQPKDPKGPEVLPQPEKVPPTPTPTPTDPFGPGRPRLPLLDPSARFCEPNIRTPVPSAKDLEEINRYVEEVIDPRSTLDLIQHRPRLLKLKENPTRTQIGDPKIAQLEVLGQKQLSILGSQVGSTVLNLWFKDGEDKERVLSYLLRVVPDPEQRARLDAVYKALAQEINHAFPDSHVCLTLVGDKVVVSGQAKDVADAAQIIRVVEANALPGGQQYQGQQPPPAGQIPLANVNVTVPPGELPGGAPNLREYLLGSASNVVNMLRVAGEQQVALKVVVAEINRSAARSIGLDFNVRTNGGITVFSQNTGGLLGTTANTAAAVAGAAPNILANINNNRLNLAINALRQLHYAKLMAEPTLTTLNGQSANFQAGGSFPIPVVTGATSTGLQGVQFVPFGVQLQFTPTITDRDRVRLNVRAEVSATDVATQTSINGANVPGLQTRNFQSTVELREGETLAVAGLIQQNNGADSSRVPFFGDLPVIGRLAGFDQVTANEKELVILVTPELVHPLDPKELPPLPGSDIWEPGDVEFYLWGRLESYRPVDYRSPVRTDLHKMLQYRRCEEKYIFGPSGHCDSPYLPHGPLTPHP
jgi:pilus assembly protein CpaC